MKHTVLNFALLFALTPCILTQAEIYKWVDEKGRTHYSDDKPKRQAEIVDVKINTFEQVTVFNLPDNPAPAAPGGNKRVIMYSTEWCGVCKKAKRYFQQQGIPFREYDIDKSSAARRRWQKLGGRGVPVILIGKQKMNGFSIESFQRIY